MTQAILFDFWGTLVENGVYSPVRQVRNVLRLQIPFQDYIVAFEESFMMKKHETLAAAFTDVCTTFGVRPEPMLIDRLIGLWNKNTLLAKPFPETEDVLNDLKSEFKLALVSNTDPFSINQVLDKFNLRPMFDTVAFSYEVGALKNDPKLFAAALKQLKMKPEDVLMIGDSLESDIKGAENAGIPAILLDRRNVREFENKIQNLRDLRARL
ncbi:MAG: HAD family hydrolase [Nanoarchaeota archaeon]